MQSGGLPFNTAQIVGGWIGLFIVETLLDIDSWVTQFAALVKEVSPAGLKLHYDPHPDLTHATIFRAVEKTALQDALR